TLGRAARGADEREHSLLVRDDGIRVKQDSLNPAQYGRVRADAERQAKNGEQREPRISKKHSAAKAQILQELIRPFPDPLFARDFLDLLDSAKLLERCISRFVRRHSSRDVSLNQKIDM